jgi:hypothetical protein
MERKRERRREKEREREGERERETEREKENERRGVVEEEVASRDQLKLNLGKREKIKRAASGKKMSERCFQFVETFRICICVMTLQKLSKSRVIGLKIKF